MPPNARYFRNDATLASRDPHKQLLASLNRVVNEYPPDSVEPGGGFYYGPVSIAYLFFCLNMSYPRLEIDSYPLSTWSAAYLEQAQNHMKEYPGPKPSKCGIADDILTLLALGAATSKDTDMAKELCDYVDVVTHPDASNEWLYGRAGYLYLLRLVKLSFVGDDKTIDMIEDTADQVIEAIMEAPRPWKWHGKAYVGAVHGLIGIITQIVLTDETWAPQLEGDLGAVLSYQYDSGNWPASIPPGKDRLVQFCHGAPGVVASLVAIKKYFPKLEDRIDGAIRRGREAIWEWGLLTKEPCLCHGISGNALALEGERFDHFLTYTTRNEIKGMEKDGMMEPSDDPSSLWCGEGGRAWAWAVADKGMEHRYIGYNDI